MNLEQKLNPKLLNVTLPVASALSGVAAVAATAYIHGLDKREESPVALFEWLFTVYVNLEFFPTILLLFVIGLVGGLAFPSRWILIGASSMLVFILAAVLEIMWGVGAHNVWPIELIIYFFFTIPSLAGAGMGRLIMKD